MDSKHPLGNFDQPINAAQEAELLAGMRAEPEGVTLPADRELEQLATKRAEQADEPRIPETPEEMIAATLDSTTGCIDAILSSLSYETEGHLSPLRDFVVQIQERLLRYLKTEKKKRNKVIATAPSAYAQRIFAIASASASSEDITGAIQISSHVMAEIQPLLHAFWETYHALTKHVPIAKKEQFGILRKREDFFDALDIGAHNNQRVYSFFGALRTIAATHEHFPALTAERPYVPAELIIADPLSASQFSYWNELQSEYKSIFKKDVSVSDIVRERTADCLCELDKLARHAPHSDTQKAAGRLLEWLSGEYANIAGASDDTLKEAVVSLHFAYGSPEEIMARLNDIETLKQSAPIVYARMMGRRAQDVIPEAARSDLFGNMFQIALYNTLHLQTGKGMEGYDEFQSYINGLTKMTVRQDEIGLMSDEDMKQLDATLLKVVEQEKENPFLGVGLLHYGEMMRAYRLKKMLENVSAENREGLLRELRVATPQEFIRLLNDRRVFPQPIESYAPDWMTGSAITVNAYNKNIPVTEYAPKLPSDVEAIFVERGFGEILAERESRVELLRMPQKFRSLLNRPFGALGDVIDNLNPVVEAPSEKKKKWEKRISDIVWKSTPSEKLLVGDEFYKYIRVIDDRISKRGGGGFDVTPVNQKDIALLWDIIDAHSDIGNVDWFKWLALRAGKFTGEGLKKSEVARILRVVFQEMPVVFFQGNSSFLRLYQFVFGYSDRFIAIAHAENSSLGAVFEKFAVRNDVKGLFYLLTHIATQTDSPSGKERSLENFDDIIMDRSLTPDESEVLENLNLFTKLIEPRMLVDYVDLFFVHHPGAFSFFVDMLSKEDRETFLAHMCESAPGSLHTEWSEQEAPLRVISAEQYLADSTISRRPQQVTLLYTILSASSRDIPDDKEYQNLKKLVMEHGYQSNQESGENRRIQYREGKGWILEEGKRKLPAVGDVLSKQEMKKLLSSELEWREIARG